MIGEYRREERGREEKGKEGKKREEKGKETKGREGVLRLHLHRDDNYVHVTGMHHL